jgi:membrane-associated protein
LNAHLSFLAVEYGLWIYLALFAIIFCETGLVVTAILPGDSLLFAAGAVAAQGFLELNTLFYSLIVAAFLGNVVNYWIGRHFGQWLLSHSRWIKPSYFDRANHFYEQQGGKTIVIARFVPILRTFAPFVAGMAKMNSSKFMIYNFLGAMGWVTLLLLGSYWFGHLPIVQTHFSFIVAMMVIISLLPMGLEYGKRFWLHKNGNYTLRE